MPQFSPGESKTAKAVMRNPKAKGTDYAGFLYMGADLAVMAEVPFSLAAGQEKQVSLPVVMPSAPGAYPVHIGVFSGGQNIALYQGEDVTIMALIATAGITGIDFGPLQKVQGESFPMSIHIESNFTGTAWVVLAYGQGQPAPGATFRAVTEGEVYKGWFPEPFRPPLNYLPAIFSVSLVAGHNVITRTATLARDLPLGDYIPYAAVMPPASDWNNWPPPYDWVTGTPFNVAEEPPPVTVDAMIGQNVTAIGAPFSWGVYGGGVYGLAGDAYNHFSPFVVHPAYCASFPDTCLLLPYMQFWQPGAITNMQIGGSSQQRWGNLGAGVYIISDPPLTPDGRPAKYYQVSLQGRLTFPNGTFLEKAMSLSVPQTSTYEYYYLPFGKEEYGWLMDTLPPGQYSFRLRVTVEGLDYGEQTVIFIVN